jgi:hypothetical protein
MGTVLRDGGGFRVAAGAGGRLELVADGAGGALLHVAQKEPGEAWTPFSEVHAGPARIASLAGEPNGALTAFAVDGAGAAVVARGEPGAITFGAWSPLGAPVARVKEIAAIADDAGAMHAWVRGAVGAADATFAARRAAGEASFGGWVSVGGAELLPLRRKDGRIELFAAGRGYVEHNAPATA